MNSQWSQCLFFAMIRPRLWPSLGLALAITLSDASFSGKLVSKRYGTLQPFDRLSEWVDVSCLTKQCATRNSRDGRGNHSCSEMEQKKVKELFIGMNLLNFRMSLDAPFSYTRLFGQFDLCLKKECWHPVVVKCNNTENSPFAGNIETVSTATNTRGRYASFVE